MFKIIMRGGEFSFSNQFRAVLKDTLLIKSEGYIMSEFDSCLIMIEDILQYEDENGDFVYVVQDEVSQ